MQKSKQETQNHFLANSKQGTHKHGTSSGNYQISKKTEPKEAKPKQGTYKHRASSGDYSGYIAGNY